MKDQQSNSKNYWHQHELQHLHLLDIAPERITYGQIVRFMKPGIWRHTASISGSCTDSHPAAGESHFPSFPPFSQNEQDP